MKNVRTNYAARLDKKRNDKTCHIDGGSCNSRDVTYASEGAKHKLIYIGYTSTTLSQRFNKHQSEAKNDPDATELRYHDLLRLKDFLFLSKQGKIFSVVICRAIV